MPATKIMFMPMLLAASQVLSAQNACDRLSGLNLPDTTITAASQITPAPKWTVENDTLSRGAVNVSQPFCRVQGRIEKEIEFEAWLPARADWNRKHLGVGNGGYAGFINYSGLAQGLRRGYATSSTDTGHKGGPMDGSWALGHQQRILDYGYRAQHLTAIATKQLIAAYYEQPAQRAYFMGCSNGGQQGLTAAQRYPRDYDGIVSGAPGTSFPDMSTYVMLSGRKAASVTVTQPQMQWAVQRMVSTCDAIDGLKDGLIEHPPSCRFDFDTLACPAEQPQAGKAGAQQAGECLSGEQVALLRDLYSPLLDRGGREIYPPPAIGALLPITELARRGKLGADMYRYAVFEDPQWDPATFVLERDLPRARERLSALISEQADLSAFAKRGGKMIIYHGWDDSGPSPYNTIAYHHRVQESVGTRETDDFMRLFMVPGMYHCGGGPGPNSFGNVGDPPILDAQHDVLIALEQWVERGAPPEQIIASKVRESQVERTRPLCPYPLRARYRGEGSIDRAENFECVRP